MKRRLLSLLLVLFVVVSTLAVGVTVNGVCSSANAKSINGAFSNSLAYKEARVISASDYVQGDSVTIDELLKPFSFNFDNSWYDISKQPKSALKEMEKEVVKTSEKKVTVYIGKKIAFVNGVKVFMDAPPEIVPPGRTYVPVRFISENLGYKVKWDSAERKVTMSSENKVIELWIGKKRILVDGESRILDSAPFIDPKYNRTYLPFRALAEIAGATVSWNPNDPLGKAASFDLKTQTVTEESYFVIDPNSDADNDGASFSEEQKFGLNPNNAHTLSPFVNDGQVIDWLNKYKWILKKTPTDDLSIPANAYLGFDPNKNHNIDNSLTDKQVLLYLKSEKTDISVSNKDDLITLINNAKKSFESNFGNLIGNALFDAIGKGYLKPDKDTLTNAGKGAMKDLELMMSNRPGKDKLENIVDSSYVETFIALNSMFGNNPANLFLSESNELKSLMKQKRLQDAGNFVKLMYEAEDAKLDNVPGLHLSMTEKDTPLFKRIVNQPTLNGSKYTFADLAFNIYNQISKDSDLNKFIDENPKMLFAFSRNLAMYLADEHGQNKDVFDELSKLGTEAIEYYNRLDKFMRAINNKDRNKATEILNSFGLDKLNPDAKNRVIRGLNDLLSSKEKINFFQLFDNFNELSTQQLAILIPEPGIIENRAIWSKYTQGKITYLEAIKEGAGVVELYPASFLALLQQQGLPIELPDSKTRIRKGMKFNIFGKEGPAEIHGLFRYFRWTTYKSKFVGVGAIPSLEKTKGKPVPFFLFNDYEPELAKSSGYFAKLTPLEQITLFTQTINNGVINLTEKERTIYEAESFELIIELSNSVGMPIHEFGFLRDTYMRGQWRPLSMMWNTNIYYLIHLPKDVQEKVGKTVVEASGATGIDVEVAEPGTYHYGIGIENLLYEKTFSVSSGDRWWHNIEKLWVIPGITTLYRKNVDFGPTSYFCGISKTEANALEKMKERGWDKYLKWINFPVGIIYLAPAVMSDNELGK